MMQQLLGEIMIIDDQPSELENLRKLLILEGFDTRIVKKSGQIFADEALANTFLDGGDQQKIFVISLELQDEDPMEVFEHLVANYPTARFGFVASSFDSERAEDFFAAGIDAFFTKPVSFEKFLSWARDTSSLAVDTGRNAGNRAA